MKGEGNRLANSFHLALVRPVWAIAIGWIIFACMNGRGGKINIPGFVSKFKMFLTRFVGPINWFLSLPTFQVLSKLTYTLYIVHYPIIYIITSQMRVVPLFNNFEAVS